MTSLSEISEVLPNVSRVVAELLDTLRDLPVETLQHDARMMVRSQTMHGTRWSFPVKRVVRPGVADRAPGFQERAAEVGTFIARCSDVPALSSVGFSSDTTECGKALLLSAVDALVDGSEIIPSPADATITQVCEAILDGFRRRQIDVEFVVPLFALRVDVPSPVNLAPGVTLTQASDRDRVEFIANCHIDVHGMTLMASNLGAVLTIVEPRLPNEPHAVTERQSRTQDLFVRALTLAGAGAPQIFGHWLRAARPSPFRLMSGGIWDVAELAAFYDTVALDAQRGDLLVKVFRALEECPKDLVYSLPMKRFVAAHRRGTTSDQVVDVWVGLEAILAGTEHGELAHRMRMRAACLLATADPAAFRKAFNDAYGERSTLVHGRPPSNAKAAHKAEQALQWAYDVLRRLLLRAVVERKFWDPVAIDDAMISGGAAQVPQPSATGGDMDWRHTGGSATGRPDIGAMAGAGAVLTREGFKVVAYIVKRSLRWVRQRDDKRGRQ